MPISNTREGLDRLLRAPADGTRRTLLARFDAELPRRPVVFAGARTWAGGVVAAAVAHDLDHHPAMAQAWRLTTKET
jgi:hypothetical protein